MLYKTSNFQLLQELLQSVPEDDRCMEWPRRKANFGYGQIKFKTGCKQAHRVAYELAHGPIPDGLFALHRCDNPACFRPSHLFLGTKLDNSRDCRAKGRMQRCNGAGVNTAKLTEDKVRAIRALRTTGMTEQAIADRFGVSQTTVNRIVNGKYWKHVSP